MVKPGYKQTEVGLIPEDWCVDLLGDIGSFKNGINKNKEDFGYGFPFVNLMDVFGLTQISDVRKLALVNTSAAEQSIYGLLEGDLLLIRSSVKPSGVGLTTVVTKNLPMTVFSGFLLRYRTEKLTTPYKRYVFAADYFRAAVMNSSTVSANTNISQNSLKQISFCYPPNKDEQNRIASVLSDTDELIFALEKLIAKKKAIKQGTMQELLTGKRRLPGFSGEWLEYQLSTLGVFLKGSGISRNESNSGDISAVRYGELYTKHQNYIAKYFSHISKEVAVNAKQVHRGDILFAASGETKEEIGKCAAIIDEELVYAGGDILIFRPTVQLAPVFMGTLLNTTGVCKQRAEKGQGDAIVHIHADALGSIKITIPDIEEQQAISEVLVGMDKEIELLAQKLEKYRQVKQGMMQQLLTGKIRLV